MRSGRILLALCLVGLGVKGKCAPTDSSGFKITDVVFRSTLDGTDQRYVLMLPDGFAPNAAYDVVIALHGHGADRWQFVKEERSECRAFRTFASRHAMIAVSPDYRAKTSWMGPAAEADLLQIVLDLRKHYRVNRLYLVGGSMGATSALTFAALHPDMIDGVTSMNGHANHLAYNNFTKAIAESFGGQKYEIPEEYKKRSAEYWPERLTMPIAFTVGELDKSVPPDSVIRLVGILKALRRKVMIIVHPQGGHATTFHEAMAAMEFMVSA